MVTAEASGALGRPCPDRPAIPEPGGVDFDQPPPRQPNGDGSSDFLAFRWDEFPPDFIIAKSWRQSGLFGEAG